MKDRLNCISGILKTELNHKFTGRLNAGYPESGEPLN